MGDFCKGLSGKFCAFGAAFPAVTRHDVKSFATEGGYLALNLPISNNRNLLKKKHSTGKVGE